MILRDEARAELDSFASKMQELGKSRVFLVGHADDREVGADESMQLSQRHADAVAAYLSERWSIEVVTAARGAADPVAGNDTAQGRQANRRVEVNILD